jgi:hypothetical protein
MGTVTVSGEASRVELVGAAGTFAPGEVPPGTYEVRAAFGDELVPAGQITVEDGGTVSLTCSSMFLQCR